MENGGLDHESKIHGTIYKYHDTQFRYGNALLLEDKIYFIAIPESASLQRIASLARIRALLSLNFHMDIKNTAV